MNRLEHPDVRAWLARLDTESAVLPDERRSELRTDVEGFLAGTLTGAAGDDAEVARALAELGDPADVVAEAGGYALPAVDAREAPEVEEAPGADDSGSPWLEVWTLTLLAASVVLALVPATQALAPLPWFLGTLMVLLSRRWGAAAKGLAVLAYGVLGVPLVLLGRDELPTGASVVVSVALVVLWVGTAVWLLLRARAPREEVTGLRMR